MAPATQVSGRKISSTAMASRHGLMVPVSKASTWRDASMDRDALLGQITAPIQARSMRIISKAKVSASSLRPCRRVQLGGRP